MTAEGVLCTLCIAPLARPPALIAGVSVRAGHWVGPAPFAQSLSHGESTIVTFQRCEKETLAGDRHRHAFAVFRCRLPRAVYYCYCVTGMLSHIRGGRMCRAHISHICTYKHNDMLCRSCLVVRLRRSVGCVGARTLASVDCVGRERRSRSLVEGFGRGRRPRSLCRARHEYVRDDPVRRVQKQRQLEKQSLRRANAGERGARLVRTVGSGALVEVIVAGST